MNPEWVGTIIVGLLASIMAYMSYRLSTRQFKAQADSARKAVDAQAYERAERIYKGAIHQLDTEINSLRAERTALQYERDQMRTELERIRSERDRLHDINNRLEEEVGKLRGFRDEAARLGEANSRLEAEIQSLRHKNGIS